MAKKRQCRAALKMQAWRFVEEELSDLYEEGSLYLKERLDNMNILVEDYETGEWSELDSEDEENEDALYEHIGLAMSKSYSPELSWFYMPESDDEWDVALEQYKTAMLRHCSWYNDNLYYHFSTRSGSLVKYRNSYMGYFPLWEDSDCFWYDLPKAVVFSHFMPASLREGMEMIAEIKECGVLSIFAVTPYLSKMLEKLGYNFICEVPQYFAGEIIMKRVYSSRPLEEEEVMEYAHLLKS